MQKPVLPLLVLTLTAALSSCGGGGPTTPNPAPTPDPAPAPSSGTTLTRAQIAGCPNVSGSSDVSASACLKGTVVGQTLGGAACKFTVRDGGSYDYAGGKLTVSHTNSPSGFNFFAYNRDIDYILWSTDGDGHHSEVKYNENGQHKMQIDVSSGGVSETCVAQL